MRERTALNGTTDMLDSYVLRLVLVLAATMGGRSASAAAPSHADLIKGMPPALLDRAGGAMPDEHGMVGNNRDGFKASAFQRGATLKLAVAAARGDRERAEQCWKAVDAAFALQAPEGHFGDPPSSVAFWLCELCRSLLVVEQSPLAGAFKDRTHALRPKVAKAAKWLAGKRDVLVREDRHAPNRLFFDAEAFCFAGLLTKDEGLQKLGREFLAEGMKLYREEDGVFLEHGGGDSSYQAVCLLRLQEILLYFPDEAVARAVDQGVKWELGRIGPEGTITTEGNTRVRPGGEKFMGKEKAVNVGEVTLALLYYHARTGNADALAAAERIHRSRSRVK